MANRTAEDSTLRVQESSTSSRTLIRRVNPLLVTRLAGVRPTDQVRILA